MSLIDPSTSIKKLATEYKDADIYSSNWYCIAACALTAAGAESYVAELYKHICIGKEQPERQAIFERIMEALIKGAWLFGLPRMLNAFYPLTALVSKDKEIKPLPALRSRTENVDYHERGVNYLRNLHQKDGPALAAPMDLVPDTRHLVMNLCYGSYMSDITILDPVATSQVTLASLLPLDLPTQLKWHMRGLMRNGGTESQIRETIEISLAVATSSGVVLHSDIPDLSVVEEEKLV